jgi:enamine deaminase RidA (YjgF/YER057c/UK114 family)
MSIDIIVPEEDRKTYESWHFAPAVRLSDLVFISGIIGQGDTPLEEFRDAWARVGRVLAETGLGYGDIIDTTLYIVGLRELAGAMARAKDEVIAAPYPASTWIGVSELIRPAARAEIKVIARVPSDRL